MNPDENNPDLLAEAHELIMLALEEQLLPEQASRLEQLVCENAEVRRLYAIYAHQRSVMSMLAPPAEELAELESSDVPGESSLHDTMVVRAISSAPVEQPEEVRVFPAPPAAPLAGRGAWAALARQPRMLAAAAAIALLIAGGLMMLILRQGTKQAPDLLAKENDSGAQRTAAPGAGAAATQPVFVARLTRQVAAQWKNSAAIAPGAGFESETRLDLTAGYVELTFASGASAVVEAPATLTVQSNAVALTAGRLAARVPPAAHGFAVSTSQSMIVDLGTEFGVSAGADGVTEVDVFKGRVTARPAAATTQPVTLTQGKAVTITPQKLEESPIGAVPQKFVRELDTAATSLDAVDLICGGDGTTAMRGTAIDQLTGAVGDFPQRRTISHSDAALHPVAVPVINGCFIPNGDTPVDSAGHRFDFRPARGMSFDYIRAGGPIHWPNNGMAVFSPILSGVNYDSAGHGLLFMHCNNGLTFDLAAIRRLCPGKTVTTFHSVVGNTVSRDDYGNDVTVTSSAWVLVDGVARFNRTFTNKDGAIALDVPIGPQDHFLTLATTATSGSKITLNWTIFGDPRFQLGK